MSHYTTLKDLTYAQLHEMGQFAEEQNAKVKGIDREGDIYTVHIELPNDVNASVFEEHLQHMRSGSWVERSRHPERHKHHPRIASDDPNPDPMSRGGL